MLRRFNRYPLIIDPSGQATEFLLNEFRDKKISKTRFFNILCILCRRGLNNSSTNFYLLDCFAHCADMGLNDGRVRYFISFSIR